MGEAQAEIIKSSVLNASKEVTGSKRHHNVKNPSYTSKNYAPVAGTMLKRLLRHTEIVKFAASH
jgi:hypothetical protein